VSDQLDFGFKVYAVLDSKGGFFGLPWVERGHSLAIRGFSDAVKDSSNPNNLWNKHPEDYTLYCIGEYDQVLGKLSPLDKPSAVVTASACVAVSPPDA